MAGAAPGSRTAEIAATPPQRLNRRTTRLPEIAHQAVQYCRARCSLTRNRPSYITQARHGAFARRQQRRRGAILDGLGPQERPFRSGSSRRPALLAAAA